MSLLPRMRSWFRASLHRSDLEREMHEELQFHIEEYADALQRGGVPADEARRRARVAFGSVDAREEECREALGLRLLDELRADLRYATRLLRDAPAFTSVAILSLALGIGANTAIFSLLHSVMWKALPVSAPEELRQLSWVSGPRLVMESTWGNLSPTLNGGRTSTSFSYPVFQQLRKQTRQLGGLFAFKPITRMTAVIDGQAELVGGELVSGDYFQTLRLVPSAGRPILPSDDERREDGTVAVISDAFWSRRFGREASAVGRSIRVNQIVVTIVGVNPPQFSGLEPGRNPDLFLPLSMQPVVMPWQYGKSPSLVDDPEYWWVLVMGRTKPGVDERGAETALDTVLRQAVHFTLPNKSGQDQPRLRLLPGGKGLDDVREAFGTQLYVLVALVGLVLAIACANLASLLLARAASRHREFSLRLALGAGRGRIARQMLTEGLLLATIGGATGIVFGYWMRNGIPHLLSTPWEAGPLRAEFDVTVLAASLIVTAVTGVLFSLAPVWQATRLELTAALKDAGHATMGRSRQFARRALIAFQVAVSVLLLIGAGLFARTLWNLRSTDLGFRAERVLLFNVDPPRTRYAGTQRTALFQQLEREVGRLPGVESSSLSSEALVAHSSSTTRISSTGEAPVEGEAARAWVNDVGDRFFETMGIPILLGRALDAQDREGSLRVAVVNQQFARKFFPGGNPLGKTFWRRNTPHHIVGICGDARYDRVTTPMPPTFYAPFAQAMELGSMTFEVRTAVDPVSLTNSIRRVVRSIDKDLPVFDVRTQVEQIDATFSRQRLFATLTLAFGLLALILACVGIYGIIASSVASRISEIGVRMALGADRRRVLFMILREAVSLAGLGIAVGLLAAAALARYVETLLYGLTPFDPLTAIAAVVLMLIVAVVSGWLPARFAAALEPMQALRHE
jgi:predicted permease